MSHLVDPTPRGRTGRNENSSQEASHHIPQGGLVSKEDVPRRKAQAQASCSSRPGPSHTKADPPIAQDVLAACTEAASELFPPALFSPGGNLALPPNSNFLYPKPDLTSGNSQRQAPENCDGCTGPAANQDDDLPHSLPLASQPSSQKEHVPKPPIEYDVDTNHRIAALDKETQTLVKSYGGYPLQNQLLVLRKVEEWQAEHGQPLMDVERKDGKGGVISVTCNVCLALEPGKPPENAHHKTVQKASEHIISFHWELSAWSCIAVSCGKIFRRKQECDRHEESHGFITKKKGKKIANQQATADTGLPPPSKLPQNPAPTTAPHKTQRHKPASSADVFLAPPSTSGGPVRPRSREPSPHRHSPYLRPTQSTPDLSTFPPQPSTSSITDVFSGYNEIPPYPPSSSISTMTPGPQLRLTNDSGEYSQLSYNTTQSGVFSPPQSGDIQDIQGYPPIPDALVQTYPQVYVPPPQVQRIAQVQDTSILSRNRPTQTQFMPAAPYGPPPRMPPYGMQSRQHRLQYVYTQPPMNPMRTTTTTNHQPGPNRFQSNNPPYASDGSNDWGYPRDY